MCERVTIIETLEKMNSNLERIATAFERAYPPVIITAQKEMTEDMRSQLKKGSESAIEFYDIVKRRWKSKYQCPRCGQTTFAYRDDWKAWYRCEECGSERTVYLKDFGLSGNASWEADK